MLASTILNVDHINRKNFPRNHGMPWWFFKNRSEDKVDPTFVDKELLSWILIINYLYLPVSVIALQRKAKSLLILRHNPSSEASKDWIRQFKEHDLSIRKRISLSQRLPSQLESKYHNFILKIRSLSRFESIYFP